MVYFFFWNLSIEILKRTIFDPRHFSIDLLLHRPLNCWELLIGLFIEEDCSFVENQTSKLSETVLKQKKKLQKSMLRWNLILRNLVSYKFYLLDVQNFRVAISEHFQLVFHFVSNLFAILKDFKLKRRSLANFRMDLSKFDTDVQHFCFFYAIPCVSTLFKNQFLFVFAEPGEEIWGNCEKFFFRGCFALFILLFLLPSGSTIRFQFSHLWIFSNFSAIFVLFLGELGMINWLNNSFSLLCNISCSRELTPTTMQHIALIYREEFHSKFNFNRTQFCRK